MMEIVPKVLTLSPDMFQMYLHELPQVDVRLDRFSRGFWHLLLAQQLQSLDSVLMCSQLISITLGLIRVPNAAAYADLFGGFQDDCSESYFHKAIFLLRIQEKETAEARLLLALSKACLVNSLETHGELFMVYDAATAYLAIMLYSEKQYQQTLDFCTSAASKISAHQISDCCRVELQLLPDCDDISAASGFSILYEFIRRNISLQIYDQPSASNDLTPTLLVYFVSAKASMRCQSDTTYPQMLRLLQLYYSFLTKSFPKALLSICDFCLYGFMLSHLRKFKLCSSVSEQHTWRDSNPVARSIIYSRREVMDVSSYDRSFIYNTAVATQCYSFENLFNRQHLIDMYIELSLDQLTDEYRAMDHYRRGEYESALRICCENLNVQSDLGVVCSRPFNLFLDDDLAKIINQQPSIIFVSFGFFLLYLKLRCMLKLQGPGSEIARGIIELTLRQKRLVALLGEDRPEVDIVRIVHQRIRTLRSDLIIHGDERISLKEEGLYTTYFIDPQSPDLIGTTTMETMHSSYMDSG